MYASDYPHTDSKFPYSVKTVRERDDLPDELLPKLLSRNAARYYGLDVDAA
jgi:predicted TIM-barrel fold metal-dependent hydrolase